MVGAADGGRAEASDDSDDSDGADTDLDDMAEQEMRALVSFVVQLSQTNCAAARRAARRSAAAHGSLLSPQSRSRRAKRSFAFSTSLRRRTARGRRARSGARARPGPAFGLRRLSHVMGRALEDEDGAERAAQIRKVGASGRAWSGRCTVSPRSNPQLGIRGRISRADIQRVV